MNSPTLDYDCINEYIRNSHPLSVVMVGCDSVRKEVHGKARAIYSTAVCIRNASGDEDSLIYRGCKVFGGSVRLPDYGKVIRSGKLANLRMRLMQEVTFALEAFENIYEAIGDRPFEIHLDINGRPDAESHVALQEARGYVMGMTGGIAPEFKPNALAASFAADRVAHGLMN
jgi:predicted RNase H-related nuclease YkuK (DUF458 family)